MVLAVGEDRAHVDGGVARQHARVERLLDARVDRRDVLLGDPAAGSIPCRRPRRELRSPLTAPTASSGTVTSSSMIGSSSTGSAFVYASLNAIEPAILNAISEESTVW